MDYIYFHNHRDKITGYLSQLYPSFFKENGILFSSTEMYMMLHKAMVFNDTETMNKILATTDPKEIKALGRTIKNFDQKMWEGIKVDIVRTGNILKFSQNVNLRTRLLFSHGDNPLFIETNPYDRVWGIGYSTEDADNNRQRWGQNLLGKILTDVRLSLLSDEGIKKNYNALIEASPSPLKRASFYPTGQFDPIM
jgi:ribA/ribD-fused uncharacterized protein